MAAQHKEPIIMALPKSMPEAKMLAYQRDRLQGSYGWNNSTAWRGDGIPMDIDEASVVEAENTPPEILQTLIASVAALAEHVKGKSPVHERRVATRSGNCFNCGLAGHFARNCRFGKRYWLINLGLIRVGTANPRGTNKVQPEDLYTSSEGVCTQTAQIGAMSYIKPALRYQSYATAVQETDRQGATAESVSRRRDTAQGAMNAYASAESEARRKDTAQGASNRRRLAGSIVRKNYTARGAMAMNAKAGPDLRRDDTARATEKQGTATRSDVRKKDTARGATSRGVPAGSVARTHLEDHDGRRPVRWVRFVSTKENQSVSETQSKRVRGRGWASGGVAS